MHHYWRYTYLILSLSLFTLIVGCLRSQQMKRRKKEEEAFMRSLIIEKEKSNKMIAKLHIKLEKR